jgi:ACR3 family arsenite efflux pump ArsB
MKMSLNWKKWTKNDLIFGVILPVVVVFVIVLISKLQSIIGGEPGIVIGLTMEILELVVIVGVPLALGLLWNQWAGGASGFLMGTFYALYWSSSFHGISGSGTILLGYILSPMLIGYMAGALNKRSDNFKRILISATVASTIGGIVMFTIFQMSPANVVTGVDGFALTVLARIIAAVLTAVVAKIFFWYGMGTQKNPNLTYQPV